MLQQQGQDQNPSEAQPSQAVARVKVYKLSPEGTWQDRGTGHISIEYLEQNDALGLVVISEDEGSKPLLVHRISEKDIYQRQGDSSIITWNDSDVGTDVAISFQESTACDQIWSSIKQVQHDFTNEGHFAGGELADGEGAMDLPTPDISNLPEVVKILTQATPFQRDRIAGALLKPGYVVALMDTFKQCEDLEDSSSLGHLFRLMKAMIMLNDHNVLEYMLKDEFVMDVVGALEYDPDLSERQHYREFLATGVVFKEVVPITDVSVLAKIHQTYRIQYIKDVILPRALDDATYATLTSLGLYNNVEVVSALYLDAHFLPELFSRLEKYAPEDNEWKDLVAFLQEFCTLSRHLQQSTRQQLFNKLVQLNLFDVITRIMKVGNEAVKLKGTDILHSIMTHDNVSLRSFLLEQTDHELFGLLCKELTEGSDGGLPEQVLELLKMLLDPETMDTTVEKSKFLEVFYDKYVNKFLSVITSDKLINPKDGQREVQASTLGTILELLCFCVQHHAYLIKYFTLRSHMVEKVLKVLRRRERWLVCSALRFLRICVVNKDDFFIRQIVKNNVFEPVMAVYFENKGRYNIVDSCIMDTIDFIQKENIKPLVEHLVEQYGHKFSDISNNETFKRLQLRYDQAQEGRQGQVADVPDAGRGSRSKDEGRWGQTNAAGGSGRDRDVTRPGDMRNRTFVLPASGDTAGASSSDWGAAGRRGGPGPSRRRRDPRGLDKDEEDYFSEDFEGDDDEGGEALREDAEQGDQVASRDHGSRRPGGMPDSLAAAADSSVSEEPSGEPKQAAVPSEDPPLGWSGLTEYGDDDEEEQAGGGAGPQPSSEGPRSSEKRKRSPGMDELPVEGAPPRDLDRAPA